MIIKKGNLELLYKSLDGADTLNLSDGRIRDAFLRSVGDQYTIFQEERMKIVTQFCTKDENGKPVTTRDKITGMQYSFTNEQFPEFQKEFDTLCNETVEIDCPKPNEIKSFIENSFYKPKPGETIIIDEILTTI